MNLNLVLNQKFLGEFWSDKFKYFYFRLYKKVTFDYDSFLYTDIVNFTDKNISIVSMKFDINKKRAYVIDDKNNAYIVYDVTLVKTLFSIAASYNLILSELVVCVIEHEGSYLLNVVDTKKRYNYSIIKYNCMEPLLSDGDIVIIDNNYDQYSIGDVIGLYKDKKTYIKRIKQISDDIITLKADAWENEPSCSPIKRENILGLYIDKYFNIYNLEADSN